MSDVPANQLFDAYFMAAPMRAVFSDRGRLQGMLDFEAALARAEARTGVVPATAVAPIEAACRAELYDPLASPQRPGPPTPLVRATPGRRSRGRLPRQKAISRHASTPLMAPFRQLPILIVVRGNLYLILNTHETYKNTHSETLRKTNARWKCNA